MKIQGIPVVFVPRAIAAEARGMWPFGRIEVGVAWYQLEPEERLALLYHEAGHLRNLHREKRWIWLPFIFAWAFGEWCGSRVKAMARSQELEADRFAAEQGAGEDLVAFLRRSSQPESHFYPSCAERVRSLKEMHP